MCTGPDRSYAPHAGAAAPRHRPPTACTDTKPLETNTTRSRRADAATVGQSWPGIDARSAMSVAWALLLHGHRAGHRGDHAIVTQPLHQRQLLKLLCHRADQPSQGSRPDAKSPVSSTPAVAKYVLQPHTSEHRSAAPRLNSQSINVPRPRDESRLGTACRDDRDGSCVIAASWHSHILWQHDLFAAS